MCQDRWEPVPSRAKVGGPVEDEDPGGPVSGDESRVWRGGSYINQTRFVRSANRRGDLPTARSDNIGFRVVRTVIP
jgi:formylglycine-generating enzyme required for sulfatase activity